ncbi:hypothetical protein [Mycobacterium uberis]|uniref:hypothetical protein n=1 Tax=Mycobacterium uberis TaxID=2162698 RepID=UPI001058A4C8|nr:hypothetical protein [Mycobacterium uberis]
MMLQRGDNIRDSSIAAGSTTLPLLVSTLITITTMWIIAGAFRVVDPRDCRVAALGRRQAAPRNPTQPQGLVSGIADGLRFV